MAAKLSCETRSAASVAATCLGAETLGTWLKEGRPSVFTFCNQKVLHPGCFVAWTLTGNKPESAIFCTSCDGNRNRAVRCLNYSCTRRARQASNRTGAQIASAFLSDAIRQFCFRIDWRGFAWRLCEIAANTTLRSPLKTVLLWISLLTFAASHFSQFNL